MNIRPNAYIWCDAVIIDLYHVGVKYNASGKSSRFTWCFSIDQGAIQACFGDDAFLRAAKLEPGGKPVPLKDVLG
ncbi:unnamed protein product [marine sediment metagenome]|uniref:Uncharacterized protein n=1 Tax=marine sediment metagenome TaxID=412755 RepID=X0XL46_9ZZZZ